MAVIINEAKSIKDPLWTAFQRFTGYNYWLEISSSGLKRGHFYKKCMRCRRDKPTLGGGPFVRFVTAAECPKIAKSHLEEVRQEHGANSLLAHSMIDSAFVDDDEGEGIIAASILEICKRDRVKAAHGTIGIGWDLAAGGDEMVVYVRRGNLIIQQYFSTERNTTVSIPAVHARLLPYQQESYVFNADNGGLGHPMIDAMEKLGWKITRRNNQSAARNKKWFGNLGYEMWHHLNRLFEKNAIIIPWEDDKLIQQLLSRTKGDATSTGKLTLKSKKELRKDGVPSPDRGDALALCFYSYGLEENLAAEEGVYKPNWVNNSELLTLYARGLPPIPDEHPRPRHFTLLTPEVFN